MAMRIGGGGSNTGGASTLHIISHDSFREHTLLADTTNGDEQDHSVGGGASVRLPPPPQMKAYSSSISRRVLNRLVKKENQIKKEGKIKPRNEWERRASPLDSKWENYKYLPYLQNAPSSHTPATTRRLSLRTLLCLLAACASHPFKAIHPKFTPEKERFHLE